jgi:hypothetical protein
MGTCNFIENLLSLCRIDIQLSSTQAEALLVTTLPTFESQYWAFVPDPAGSGYNFIKN